eukprot:GEMP01046864.1.p1 GENE.GEMP01046864.1~~GEMP01046864.1.p1  ORF type:complete len:211 (-),score=48.17 GEMP01046864.1:1049-1681(-)
MIHDFMDRMEPPIDDYDPDPITPSITFPKIHKKVLILCPANTPCLKALQHLWSWTSSEKNFFETENAMLWALPPCPPPVQRTLVEQAVDAITPERLAFVDVRLRTTISGPKPEEPALVTLANFDIEEKDVPLCHMQAPDQVDLWGASLIIVAEERKLEAACLLPVQDGVEPSVESLRALCGLGEICSLGAPKPINTLVPSPVRGGMSIYL